MEVEISKIKVDKRFRRELGDLTSLMESIKEVGLLHPIVTDEEFTLIAGQRRLEACKKLGWPSIPVNVVSLVDIVKGEFHENFVRKDFTVSEMVEIKRAIESEVKVGQGKRIDLTSEESSEVLTSEERRTRNKISKFVGVSHDTLRKAEELVDYARKEPETFKHILDKVDSGNTSLNYAYQMVKRRKEEEERMTKNLPKGEFDIIYADPPWRYNLHLRGSPNEHYLVNSIEEIVNLPKSSSSFKISKNAILFLWATNPKLEDALKVLYSWGFTYKTNIVWIKEKFGTGYYVRGQHELLLIGEKGDMPTPFEENRPSSVLYVNREKHSEKPEEVYDLIEKMYPNRRYIELYARNERAGWVSWGNELGEV